MEEGYAGGTDPARPEGRLRVGMLGTEDAAMDERLVGADMLGVTVGVGREGGDGLSSSVMVRFPELDTPELPPLTASA